MCLPSATIVDEREPLPFGILEIERQPPIAHRRRFLLDPKLIEPLRPKVEPIRAVDPQTGAYDRAATTSLPRHRPIEERHIRPRTSQRIGIEEMVGRDVILVDTALDQPHPQCLSEKPLVLPNLCRDCGEMVNPE